MFLTAQSVEAKPSSSKSYVSVIDETAKHRRDISKALMSFYAIESFEDGSKALDQFHATPPTVIVLDKNAGSKGGLDVLREIRSSDPLKEIPIIFTSAEHNEEQFGEAKQFEAVVCLTKPFKLNTLLEAISGLVNGTVEKSWDKVEPIQRSALMKTVSAFNTFADMIEKGEVLPFQEVKQSCEPLVEAVQNNRYGEILKGLKGHDNFSYVHSMRVATLLSHFGHTIGIRGDDLLILASGGLVHDVGKVAIPHEILNKAGKLESDDMTIMRSHVKMTVDFLERSHEIPSGAMVIAKQHHERLDGSGYPKGLKGKELNELARMTAIVDMFGALTDRRIYRDSVSPEEALLLMTKMRGELDQHLLSMFRNLLMSVPS